MVKVHLHGILDVVGKPLEFEANTVREAATATMLYLRRAHNELFTDTLKFQILGVDSEHEYNRVVSEDEEIHIMPALSLGKKGGILQVIVGAVLIVAGVLLINTPFGAPLIAAGIGSLAGGVIQLLTPIPTIDQAPEDTSPLASKYISGTGNTTKQGTRISLGYGTFIQYGHFLSINVQSQDIATGPYVGTPFSPYNPNYGNGYAVGVSGSSYAFR